jgi:hypothetical protein
MIGEVIDPEVSPLATFSLPLRGAMMATGKFRRREVGFNCFGKITTE